MDVAADTANIQMMALAQWHMRSRYSEVSSLGSVPADLSAGTWSVLRTRLQGSGVFNQDFLRRTVDVNSVPDGSGGRAARWPARGTEGRGRRSRVINCSTGDAMERAYSGVGSASKPDQLTLDTPFSMLRRLASSSSLDWSFGCNFSVAVTSMRCGVSS